jgi:hypothetical protein
LAQAVGRLGDLSMDDEGFRALVTIGEGRALEPARAQRWINAFKAIRWVVETEVGFALTSAGRKAWADAATERGRPRPNAK